MSTTDGGPAGTAGTAGPAAANLSAEDRCDRCGAQAYVLVRLHSGKALQFCVHHYTAHSKALAPLTSEIVDESSRLYEHATPR